MGSVVFPVQFNFYMKLLVEEEGNTSAHVLLQTVAPKTESPDLEKLLKVILTVMLQTLGANLWSVHCT